MSWLHYYLPLVIGVAIASVGVLFAVRTINVHRSRERTIWRTIATIMVCGFLFAFTAVGLCAIAAVLAGSSPWDARRVSESVFRALPSEVTSIEIRPFPNAAYPQLVSEPLLISNAEDIERICTALSAAETYTPNHPHSKWSCFLVLSIDGQSRACEVRATSNNGVLVETVSGTETSSWRIHYGTYQSNQLGSVLSSLADR